MYQVLVNCPLFKGLNIEEITEMMTLINHQVKTFRKNDLIALSGDKIMSQLIILAGSVKGEMVDFTGKTIKIEDIECPRPLAPAFLFGNNNNYPVNVLANGDTKILSIPKDSFIKLLQLNEVVLKNYLDSVSNRAQFLSNKIKFLSFQSIKGKIAHYILEIRKRTSSDSFILPKSQNELAELFGVARPSLGRAMREMHNDGLIEANGKNIIILNEEKLSSLLK